MIHVFENINVFTWMEWKLPEKQYQSQSIPFNDAFWPATHKKFSFKNAVQSRTFLQFTEFVFVLKVWESIWRKEIKILKFAVDWNELPAKRCLHGHYQEKYMK